MKRWIVMAAVLAAILAASPAPSEGGDDAARGAWCPINGTFVGQLPDWSMGLLLSLIPDSPNSGSATMQLIGGDPTLGGYFPTVVRLATALAHLWQRQGRCQEAREVLQPVYDWFTEGLDTAPLVAARALLEELS